MLAQFVTPLVPESHFCLGGDHGLYMCQRIEGFVGAPGLFALLVIVAILFLMYVSSETVFFIRRLLNPTGFLKRVQFTVNDPTDKPSDEDSYENLIETEEDPDVFDNPEAETITVQ